ncbi:hypothetical protein BY996DRAFT_7439018 [Phakopsora pachyrhizi]|nr:hypothetical protein BY996DRAFT_7439018 [Phakopsora pachyrhizi]
MPLNSKSAASCVIYPVREDQHAYNHSNSHSQRHPSHQADLLPLKEYQHISKRSQDGHRTVEEVVTIESVANQKFFISVELDPNSYSSLMSAENEEDGRAEFENDYLIFVYMDGVKVQRSKRHRSHVGPTRVSGAYTSDLSASRSFQFGKLSLVDVEDESLDNETLHRLMSELCNDERVMQSLGTIRIDIHRCRLGKSTKTKPRDSSDRGRGRNRGSSKGHQRADQRGSGEAKEIRTSNQMKFSEQSKKVMLSHTAGLGDALPVEGVTRSKFKRDVEQKDEHPFLRFIFNYKSRSLLEAEGIIQPSQPQTRVTEARSEPRQRQRPGSQQDDPQSWSGKRKDPPKKEDSDDDDFLLFDLSPRKQNKSGQQASSLHRSDEHHSKKNEQEKESYKEPRDEVNFQHHVHNIYIYLKKNIIFIFYLYISIFF